MKKTKNNPPAAPKLLAEPLLYNYYITYQWKDGVGYSLRSMAYPLNTAARIFNTAEFIRRENNIKGKVILTNWKLL